MSPADQIAPQTSTSSGRTAALLAILACFGVAGGLKIGDAVVGVSSGEALAQTADAPSTAEAAPEEPAVADAVANADPAEQSSVEPLQEDQSQAEPSQTMDAQDDQAAAEASAAPMRLAQAAPDATPTRAATEESRLLAQLRSREVELETYAAELDQRQQALDDAAARLEQRIALLESSKRQFEQLVETVNAASERDVNHLIAVYHKMKPAEAGQIFDAMDPAFAAGFLARMKPDRAAAILAAMATPNAYAVSLQMAGRNVLSEPN